MILSEGATGPLVVKLQNKLKALGFDPGDVDGDFGPKTTAAVVAFQQSKQIAADGIVGPVTLEHLGLTLMPSVPVAGASITKNVTPELVAQILVHSPLGNIRQYLPDILKALDADSIGDKQMVLMALATVYVETGQFIPIDEYRSRYNTSQGGHPFDLYDNRSDLGNRGYPDGKNFKGRGFIQLTGRDNYTRFSHELGLGEQLVNQPDLANSPKIAAQLLARFLKAKESRIRNALSRNDLATARQLVNGGSHGLAQFVDVYRRGDKLL